MEPKFIPNLIIGAGPAGLAVAGRLSKLHIPFEIIERSDKIAYSWHNHYDRLCLHTVKQLSHLPFVPFSDDMPTYIPRKDLVEYYENYAKYFRIRPKFNEEVHRITRKDKNHWKAEMASGTSYVAENIVIATGVNRVPYSPKWDGIEKYKGKLIHSRVYKNTTPYIGDRVLIIGFGNTGAEIALDMSENHVDVSVSVRSPVAMVPRDVNGRPVQLTAKQLDKLPFGIGDWLGTRIRKMVIGDLSKYGLPMSKVHPAIQLRETGKTPVIDLGTAAHIKEGRIKIVGDIKAFYEEGVIMADGSKETFDSVILATGYKAKVEEFIPGIQKMLDPYKVPKQAIGEGEFDGLFFVGFDNYKLGGILGTIYSDSSLVTQMIQAKNELLV